MAQFKDSIILRLLEEEFLKKQNTDCEIHVGGSIFKSYKLVLCLFSPVIKAMFEHDEKVQKTSQIKLQKFEPQIVEKMLKYFYAEEKCVWDDCSREMFELADFLQVDCLKEKCLVHMSDNLDLDSAIDLINLAYQQNSDILKIKVTSFLATKFESIDELEGFDKLDEKVAIDLLKRMYRYVRRDKERNALSLTVEQVISPQTLDQEKLQFVLKNTGDMQIFFKPVSDANELIEFGENYDVISPKSFARFSVYQHVGTNWVPSSIEIKYACVSTEGNNKALSMLDPSLKWKTWHPLIDAENTYSIYYPEISDDEEEDTDQHHSNERRVDENLEDAGFWRSVDYDPSDEY